MKFENQIAIIAGGAGGIGKGITLALAKEGAHVEVWDINEDALTEVEKEVKELGGSISTNIVNIFEYDTVKTAVDNVVGKHGKLDIMVSTVGGGTYMPFVYFTPDLWQKELNYNLTTVFNCFHTALGHMVKQNHGRLLCFVSATHEANAANLAGYAAAKAGCKALVEAVAYENIKNNITANAIMPGYVLTPFTSKAFEGENGDALKENVLSQLPIGPNTPENVGKTAVDILSNDRLFGQVINLV